MSKKDGKFLERIIASIEQALADDTNTTIDPNKKLVDRTTGRLREHDVVVTLNQGHHKSILAIECRDRSRPVGVPQVEAFGAKCADTGINQGIIVSPLGFYNTARTKAEHLGIRCLDFEEVDSFNWMLAPGIQSLSKRVLDYQWVFYPMKDGVVTKDTMEIVDPNGELLDPKILAANVSRLINKFVSYDAAPSEKETLKTKVLTDGFRLRNRETQEETGTDWAIVTINYAIDVELIPFRFAKYSEKDEEKNISDVAIAELKIGDKKGELMIVYDEDEGGKVLLLQNYEKNGT